MFASRARTDGLTFMAEHRIKEGMYLAAWYVRWQKGHGAPGRVPIALAALESHGTHAKAMLAYLQEHYEYWAAQRKPGSPPNPDDTASLIAATIKKIEAADQTPELISISQYLTEGDIPPKDGP